MALALVSLGILRFYSDPNWMLSNFFSCISPRFGPFRVIEIRDSND